MATIQFSNGQKVEFNGTPTEADIQHVVQQLGLNKPMQPQGENGLQGFATGLGKSVAGTVSGAGTLLQNIGTGVTKAILPASAENFFGVDQMGINALKTGTKQNQTLRQALEAKGFAEKLGKTTGDIGTFIAGGNLASAGTVGAGKLAQIGGQVASDVAVTAAQQGNLDGTGKQALLTAGLSSVPLVGPVLGKLGTGKIADNIAKNIEKINLRLTPTQKVNLGSRLDEVTSFLSKEKIVGNPVERLEKVNKLYNQFETKIQDVLKSKGVQYTKEQLVKSVDSIPEQYLSEIDNPAVYNQMKKEVNQFKRFIQDQPNELIDASRVNQFKRTFASNARNKAGDVVTNEAREAMSDGIYNLLKKDVPELEILNQEYAPLIISRKLLKVASGRGELGLVGNLVSTGVGASLGTALGGPVGAAAGAIAGQKLGQTVAGTKVRSLVGSKVQSFADYLNNAKVDEAGNFIIPRGIINGLFND